jgi:hypothetical protein
MSDDLVAFLRARLDEDALWATEASRRDDRPVPEGGVHWEWVEPETDTPVTPDPSRGEDLTDDADNFRFSLRSVEEFPTGSGVGPLPQFAIPYAEEIPAAVAGHVVRHDPARVLADVAAKLAVLDHYAKLVHYAEEKQHLEYNLAEGAASVMLKHLAVPYREHPEYKTEWAP